MAQFTVRNLEESVKTRLKQRARRHGSSLEEEVRSILRDAVKAEGKARTPLGTRIAQRFAGLGLSAEIRELRGGVAKVPDFKE